MKQIILIHGGDCFATEEDFLEALKTRDYDPFLEKKRRKDRLTTQLKDKYQIMKPEMPNKRNAKYKEWKVRFERHFPFFNDEELIVIGHSLGTIFLAKYLTKNNFPK